MPKIAKFLLPALLIAHFILLHPIFSSAEKTDKAYLIGPEDILEISVWKDPSLTKEVVVRPDGKISFPLIGELTAGGVSVEELEKELKSCLEKFIPDAVVTVMVIKVNSLKIYVLGKIARPGVYSIGKPINVLQALALAGGLTPFAKAKKILILRNEDSYHIKIPFNYEKIEKGESLELNISLQSGDVVVVP